MKPNCDRSITICRKTTKIYHPRADDPLLLKFADIFRIEAIKRGRKAIIVHWKYALPRQLVYNVGCLSVKIVQLAFHTTGSPSSKCEHRRASALLRNIQNIRICMGKNPIVSVTYENERISIKKQRTLLKMCVTSLLCGPGVDLWPFYGFLCLCYIERKPFT